MGTILRIVILLWPFLREIIKNSSAGRLKKGNRFDKTMLMLNIIMFLLFLYISDHAFKFANLVEVQQQELSALIVHRDKQKLASERLIAVLGVTREQVSVQKTLITQYRDKNEQLLKAVTLQKDFIDEQELLIAKCVPDVSPATPPRVVIKQLEENHSNVLDRFREIRESEND